jgi:hypothetical protein
VISKYGPEELDFAENVLRKMYNVGIDNNFTPGPIPGCTAFPATPGKLLVEAGSLQEINATLIDLLAGGNDENSEEYLRYMCMSGDLSQMSSAIRRSMFFVIAHEPFHLQHDDCKISGRDRGQG